VAVGPGGGVGVGLAAEARLIPPKASRAMRQAMNRVRAKYLGMAFSLCAMNRNVERKGDEKYW
jgi:hypothetical protein